MSKSKKSVFNKPMREVKKKPSPISEYVAVDTSSPFKDAIDNLYNLVSVFKTATGDQDVNRRVLNEFLAELDTAINKVSAVFEQ